MAETKTKPTSVRPADFIAAVENPRRRDDAEALCALFGEVTGEPPVMWGPTIVGFGRYRYAYASGHSGEMCRVGFSPRKAQLVLYLGCDTERGDELLARMGKFKASTGGCLYVNKLDDVDLGVLRALVAESYAAGLAKHPPEPVPA